MNSANSNTYSHAAEAALARFAAFVHGEAEALACVVGSTPPSAAVEAALSASFERLGYGANACAWISLAPLSDTETLGAADATGATSMEGATSAPRPNADPNHGGDHHKDPAAALPDADLYLLIESLDPLCLVATDTSAAAALSRIYRATLTAGTPARLLGRPTLTFTDFATLISTPAGKQKAWSALKKLAR